MERDIVVANAIGNGMVTRRSPSDIATNVVNDLEAAGYVIVPGPVVEEKCDYSRHLSPEGFSCMHCGAHDLTTVRHRYVTPWQPVGQQEAPTPPSEPTCEYCGEVMPYGEHLGCPEPDDPTPPSEHKHCWDVDPTCAIDKRLDDHASPCHFCGKPTPPSEVPLSARVSTDFDTATDEPTPPRRMQTPGGVFHGYGDDPRHKCESWGCVPVEEG